VILCLYAWVYIITDLAREKRRVSLLVPMSLEAHVFHRLESDMVQLVDGGRRQLGTMATSNLVYMDFLCTVFVAHQRMMFFSIYFPCFPTPEIKSSHYMSSFHVSPHMLMPFLQRMFY